jgi:hypothetical protein
MVDQPVAISDITDPTQIRVKLLASGRDVHAPLSAVAASAIHGAPTKTTPVDADQFGYWDSVGLQAVKTTWANIKATLKTYFDTLYQPLAAALTSWAGVTRAAGFDTFAATPSSANLRALLTDEVGTGSLVFATSPTLVTPALGTPTALVLTNATGLPNASVIGLGSAALKNTGTSGNTVSLLDGVNTWSGAQTFSSSAKSTSASGGIGYATGAGGTVTQATSKATAITLNAICGQVTLNNSALAAGSIQNIAFNNSAMAAGDVIIINHISGGTLGAYTVGGRCNGSGVGAIDLRNNTAVSLSEALVLQFAIVKAVNS